MALTRKPAEYAEAYIASESAGIHWRAAAHLGVPRAEMEEACEAHPEVAAARREAKTIAAEVMQDRVYALMAAGNMDAIKTWERMQAEDEARERANQGGPRRGRRGRQ